MADKHERTQYDIDNNISQEDVDFWEGMMDECLDEEERTDCYRQPKETNNVNKNRAD